MEAAVLRRARTTSTCKSLLLQRSAAAAVSSLLPSSTTTHAKRFGEARLRLTHPLQQARQGFGFVIRRQCGDDHARDPTGTLRAIHRRCAAIARPAVNITMNKYIARINR